MVDDFRRIADAHNRAFQGFKDDPLGSLQRGVDNSAGVPNTRTRTSYALTLHARVGKKVGVIGAVHEIVSSQSLQLDEVYEVNALSKGVPRELIPQILSRRSMNIGRHDLYASTIETVFGLPAELALVEQTLGPVSIRWQWKVPGNAYEALALPQLTPRMAIYEFVDGYLTTLTRTANANNVIVGTQGVLTWRTIRQLQ